MLLMPSHGCGGVSIFSRLGDQKFVCFPSTSANCFRCELPIIQNKKKELPIIDDDRCYGCTRCNHFVHKLCFNLPQDITHPFHSEHSLTLFPSPNSQITGNCNQCCEHFLGGYTYSCQECLNFNLHLKCFLTLNLETKHCHPLRLCEEEDTYEKYCRICGLLIDYFESYTFACKSCEFFIHFDCTFLPPTVKHRHVHELTFEYTFPERSKIVDCDVCLDGEELDRTLSYYYCERCDYIAHVRCVISQPAKVTTQLNDFIHEHPMIFLRKPIYKSPNCAACIGFDEADFFYFCNICNYALHKSCAQFPRFIKHPNHKENHTLSLQSSDSQYSKLFCCGFSTKVPEVNGWILQCLDCNYAVHLFCARRFEHPLYKDKILSFSSYEETKFRCNACGELGDGFRMSKRAWGWYWLPEQYVHPSEHYDLHIECFGLPGKIRHGCHSHPLYLINLPTEIESNLSTIFQCDICHTEADPNLWVYCCEKCKYMAHLKCVVSDLLPAPGRSCDISNFCSISMCEKEKFRVSNEVDCSKLVVGEYFAPVFLLGALIQDPKLKPVTSLTDLDKSFTDSLNCPKCEQLISVQAYSNTYDWVHFNVKPNIFTSQNRTPEDHESLALLDEKVIDELYCPICNVLIFPPTYSCADCQIFFHKSCAELPRKFTDNVGHSFVLQSPSMNDGNLTNCSHCKHPFKGYAYFCRGCEIGFDVACAMGAPLLKLENQKHTLYASTSSKEFSSIDLSATLCKACGHKITYGSIFFRCGSPSCSLFLHAECAMLPSMVKVKRRIHHHPLVLEPHLDLSVDDYICDVCEKELNPCIWVYRCSDSCGDRATSHISCIVTSNKKCHFVYDEECSYPHLNNPGQYNSLVRKIEVPALAAAIVNKPPEERHRLLHENLFSFIDDLEHEYCLHVTDKLMEMDQAEVLHLMESPDALRAKVAETMKHLMRELPDTNDEDVKGGNEGANDD